MRRRRRRRRQQQQAALIAVVVALVLGGGLVAAGVFEDKSTWSGCVVVDVSGSTKKAREDYVGAFGNFARDIGLEGGGRVATILAAGNPLSTPPAQNDVGPNSGNSKESEAGKEDVRRKVVAATTALNALLKDPPVRRVGSELVEAASQCKLESDDRLLFLSDGIQSSGLTGDFHNVDLSDAGIARLLDKLEDNDLIPDFHGARILMPLLLYHPGGSDLTSQQEVRIRVFWDEWAKRSKGKLDD